MKGLGVPKGNAMTGTVPTTLERSSGFTNFSELTLHCKAARTSRIRLAMCIQ